ncbi:MAG TPA: outer membrane protein assembly factor BamA, partial [Thermoanaerobaculia bacterium]|nr:outer membrane protein assembly factor BamA [Thermoanaerobaculia bacterium]
NFSLQVTGEIERMLAQGEVNVTRAVYSRDFDLQQSIVNLVLSRRGIVPIVPASWQDNVMLRIDVNAPGTLAVRNNIADVTGSADLDVMGTLANPVILGNVELDEGGKVTFQNIEYSVVRGTINFQNPFRIDPYFDVTLEGRVSGVISEMESGPVDLTVNITGTLDRITPSITSDPPTSDITLFSLLGFGGLAGGPGSEPGPGAGVLGQSLLYQSLFSALGQRILPFADSFTYDPGLLDTGSGGGPKVTFEKRVSDEIRLLVVYNLDSHKSREVIEWQVTRDWTLQITRDESEREWRTEGRFRRRYRGHWTWGRRGRGAEIFPLGSAEELVSGEVAIAPPPPPTRVTPLDPGSVVQQVNIHADGAFDISAIDQYVTIEPGHAATRRAIQQSIKALFATGHFRDIRVEAEPVTDGVSLTFVLSVHYRIGDIDVAGVTGGNQRRAERRIGVRVGQVLSLNAVDDTARDIQEELRNYGYLEATVDPETRFVRQQNRAEVIFHVNAGPEARVGSVGLEGNLAPFTEEELISRMRQKPGVQFQLPSAREDVDRIRRLLFERDHRRGEVELVTHLYDEASRTVALQYRVDAGPVVRVEVEGVPRSAVRGQLPFRSRDEEYSEDAIARAADDMVESYQQRGYFNATVDTESRRKDGVWTVTFHVDPGERYRLTDVTFSGNRQVSANALEDVVASAPSGGFRRLIASIFRRPTGVTREQLSEDRDALESYYRLQGFSEATVASPAVTTRADGTMKIEFQITEGPQTIVSGAGVEGLEQVTPEQLPALRIRAGRPLNPQLVREDVIALQTFYAERGNAEVQVTPRVVVSDDRNSATVSYVIAEGPRINVHEVIVRGNTYTSSEVILRQSNLQRDNPFNYSSILQAQRNLYRLGIFQRVDVQPVVAGTSPSERDVVISVEDGRNLTISGSVGVRYDRLDDDEDRDTVAPRLAGAVAHRNLFGTGRFLGLEAVWSQDEREAFLTYREPFIGPYDVPVQINVFQTDDGTVRDRRVRQLGTSIEASKVAGLRTRWSAQYQYKISECLGGALCRDAEEFGAVIPGLDRSLLDIEISSITPTFFWDKRDDIIDPQRGFFTSASVEYAFPLFSAEAHFAKQYLQGAWYLPVTARSVVALSARFGFIQPLRADNLGTPLDESRFIPVAERFTAGGDTSHRAYPLDLLGTLCADNDGGFQVPFDDKPCEPTLVDINENPGEFTLAPLGGNSMFIFNAEYRFPIFSRLGGAVFTDVGNVFSGTAIDFDNLRVGVGAGIRYLSPVGPLRIDIGWPLERRVYDRSFNYSITLGHAF